jgi:predicted GNAT family acetyltransferase
MSEQVWRALCQQRIADEPRWLEATALLQDPTARCEPIGDAWLLRHEAAGLAVVVGAPTAEAWRQVLAQHAKLAVLFDDAEPQLVEIAQAAGRHVVAVTFSLLDADRDDLAEQPGAVPLGPDESLAHVEPILRAELERVRTDRTLWVVHVDGVPVSFAYAGWRTTRWFDVSIDTLREYRQWGLASITVTALLVDEMRQGRQPVWGAVEGNIASQRLAAKLGFTPHSRAAMVVPT